MGYQHTQAPRVVYCDKGMANFYGDFIEINRLLKKDKELRDYIVKHELGHIKSFDLKYELSDSFRLIAHPRIALKLLMTYALNPCTWTDLLPVQIKKKQVIYDLNLSILYIFIGALIYFSLRIV